MQLDLRFLIILVLEDSIYAKIYELTEDRPSYAIHGQRMVEEPQLMFTGCTRCDYLIDFSRRGCDQSEAPERSQVGLLRSLLYKYKLKFMSSQNIHCYDPLPVKINEEILDIRSCPGILPYDEDFDKYLYSCSYEFKNVTQFRLGLLDNVVNFEFAVSIRVVKWVDASKKVLVIPGILCAYSEDQSLNWWIWLLIEPNTLAILVRYPHSMNSDPDFTVTASIQAQVYNLDTGNLCGKGYYKPDLTCGTYVKYWAYPGPAPGKTRNSTRYLVDFDVEMFMDLRSSVVTIFTDEMCSFCLQAGFGDYIPPQPLDEGLFRDGKVPLNSYEFPWRFDKTANWTQCQSWYLKPTLYLDMMLNVSLVQQIGGRLSILAHPQIHLKKFSICNPLHLIYNYTSIQDQQDFNFQVLCFCVFIHWCPTTTDPNQTSGFFLVLQKDSQVITDDATTILIPVDGPPLVLSLMRINFLNEKGVVWIDFEDCESDCEFIIDFTLYCSPIPNVANCSITLPLYINEKSFVPEHCETRYVPYTGQHKQYCQHRLSNQFNMFTGHIELAHDDLRAALSIRAVRTSSKSWENYDYQLEATGYGYGQLISSLAFRVESSPRVTWLVLCFRMPMDAWYLDKLRWDHSEGNDCMYELLEGPPPVNNQDYRDQIRWTFSDKDPFVGQYLEAGPFSIRVPAGCMPSIKLDRYIFNQEQSYYEQVCNGEIPVVTPSQICDPKENYCRIYKQLDYQIECANFLIEITVEVSFMKEGDLRINFFDVQGKELNDSMHIVDPIDGNAQYYSSLEARKVEIYWQNLRQENYKRFGGLRSIVHVKKKTQ